MGVDFDSCDVCDECTCDENITYLDLDGFGHIKVCSICVRYYFVKPEPFNEPEVCYEELNNASKEESVTFYRAKTKHDDEPEYAWDDVVEEYKCAQTAYYAMLDNEDDGKHSVFGFSCAWEPRKEKPGFYDPADGDLPLGEAAIAYADYFEKTHGYDAFDEWKEKNMRPNIEWKAKMKRKLDEEIKDLQTKRRKLDKL